MDHLARDGGLRPRRVGADQSLYHEQDGVPPGGGSETGREGQELKVGEPHRPPPWKKNARSAITRCTRITRSVPSATAALRKPRPRPHSLFASAPLVEAARRREAGALFFLPGHLR